MEQRTLTLDQQRIFDICENTDRNVFICGKPGTGKTVLERAMLEYSQKPWTVAAPTGLAAINAGGKTLHSVFGIPVSDGIFHHDYNNFTTIESIQRHVEYGVKYLLIDEVSMVRADTFDYIDRMLRHFKKVDKPFGGIQIVIVGDLYQLPPVMGRDAKDIKLHFGSPFVFDSKVFAEADFQIEELTEVLRQKGDDKFIRILHSARTGEVNDKQLAVLNKQVKSTVDDIRIRLAGTNKETEIINSQFLRAIQSEAKTYQCREFGKWPEKEDVVPLTLKVGAQVMVKVNKADIPNGQKDNGSVVVNGSLGVVMEMREDAVMVQLDGGPLIPIYKKRREHKVKELQDGKRIEVLKAAIEQVPLKLAWAISIHKSQGQSFDKVHVDAKKIFAAGQLYVALSRARSLEGLTLANKLTAAKFFCDEDVEKFFKQLKQKTYAYISQCAT
jgi:ATP-dependent DNA helicase PIF1